MGYYTSWMIAFSLTYILSAISFYHLGLGDASLVYANMVNLSARIIYCLRFATRYFTSPSPSPLGPRASTSSSSGEFRWRSAIPSTSLFVVCGLSTYATYLSERWLGANARAISMGRKALFDLNVLTHIGIGGALALLCLGVWWITEGRYLGLSLPRRRETTSSDKIE